MFLETQHRHFYMNKFLDMLEDEKENFDIKSQLLNKLQKHVSHNLFHCSY